MLGSIFAFLKTILDIKRITVEIKTFVLFLKRNKIINFPIIISFLFLIVSFLFLIVLSYELIGFFYKDSIYIRSKKRIEIIQKIDNVLKACGDKTAITISTISINQDSEGNHWSGSFDYARACDLDNNPKDCIINLIDFNDLYRKPQKIDQSTYQFLVNIGDNQTPTYFSLRGDNNEQDLEFISDYPTMVKILTSTNWYREQKLNSLWVTSVVNFNKKVIYVLSMTSAKPIKENTCLNQSYSLLEIKNELGNDQYN